MDYIEDTTALVATYMRHDSLCTLIESAHKFYPNLKFVIADSSPEKEIIVWDYIEYLSLPSDSWISNQRNAALSKINTRRLVLLDDDFIFVESTKLENFYEYLTSWEFDIIWWCVNNVNTENFFFHWDYEIIWDTLYHRVAPNIWNKFDVIFNFFLWDTDKIKNMWGWDPELKYAKEHDDFFLTAKKYWLKVWYTWEVTIDHNHTTKHHGWEKWKTSTNVFLKKRWIKNKVEVRLILNKWNPYISYHNVVEPNYDIQESVKDKIYSLYWVYPINITNCNE